jgi:hypothetical protein
LIASTFYCFKKQVCIYKNKEREHKQLIYRDAKKKNNAPKHMSASILGTVQSRIGLGQSQIGRNPRMAADTYIDDDNHRKRRCINDGTSNNITRNN